MPERAPGRMTPEEFYAWQEGMDERYELVDGYPAPRRPENEMMTGASRRHDQIVFNIMRQLGNQLEGGACRGFTADTAVRTAAGRRRPDAGVECGSLDDNSYEAGDVRMIVEVLSPSTRDLDTFRKLDEYKAIDGMDYVLLVEPNAPAAILWSRPPDRAWIHAKIEGLDGVIEAPSLGLQLQLRDCYAGLAFRPFPKLVE